MINYRARIYWIDTEDGDYGIYIDDYPSLWDNEDGEGIDDFLWDEGNYACDCNRGIKFKGINLDDAECSENRFEIARLEAIDNNDNLIEILYEQRK